MVQLTILEYMYTFLMLKADSTLDSLLQDIHVLILLLWNFKIFHNFTNMQNILFNVLSNKCVVL